MNIQKHFKIPNNHQTPDTNAEVVSDTGDDT